MTYGPIKQFDADPPRLLGSRDPQSGETYFPPRLLSVDGSLRELDPVDLSTEGVLYAWTEFRGTPYGQVDLPEGVRVLTKLAPGDHTVGDRYVLEAWEPSEGETSWRFAHA